MVKSKWQKVMNNKNKILGKLETPTNFNDSLANLNDTEVYNHFIGNSNAAFLNQVLST